MSLKHKAQSHEPLYLPGHLPERKRTRQRYITNHSNDPPLLSPPPFPQLRPTLAASLNSPRKGHQRRVTNIGREKTSEQRASEDTQGLQSEDKAHPWFLLRTRIPSLYQEPFYKPRTWHRAIPFGRRHPPTFISLNFISTWFLATVHKPHMGFGPGQYENSICVKTDIIIYKQK